MNEIKLIESTTELNDTDFLNQQLAMEITKISLGLNEKLAKYKDFGFYKWKVESTQTNFCIPKVES